MNAKESTEIAVQKLSVRVSAQVRKVEKIIRDYNLYIVFAILVVISSVLSPHFLTAENVFKLLRQVSVESFVAYGMLLVILTGGVDLSVGSIVALVSVLVAKLQSSIGLPAALVIVLALGLVLGAINGWCISYRGLQPFVMTLGMMTIARGFAFVISKGQPIFCESVGLKAFGSGFLGPFPLPVLVAAGTYLLVLFVLRMTVFGRVLTAVGSNEEAVRLSGLDAPKYKLAAYAISGFLSAVSGVVIAARVGVGSPLLGSGYELDGIAAVVIGGASMMGGKGFATNTTIGVLVLGLLSNIMNLINVPAYPQQIVKGLIIIAAVFTQRERR